MSNNRGPASARQIVDALASYADQVGVRYEIQQRGKHPYMLYEKNGITQKQFFSGSPSDPNAHKAALKAARALFREIGWDGDGGVAEVVKQPVQLHALRGVTIPTVPEIARRVASTNKVRLDPEYIAFTTERTAFVRKVRAAGASWMDAANALQSAGHPVSADTLKSAEKQARRKEREIIRQAVAAPKPQPPSAPEVQTSSVPSIDGIATQIALLVKIEVEKVRSEMQPIMAKAEKWDAIKELISDD